MTGNRVDVVIVGAGPAGIAAAVRAASCGKQVCLVDDNPTEGGQIWRGKKPGSGNSQAAAWFRRLEASGAKVISGTRIIGADVANRELHAESDDAAFVIQYGEAIIATGARELFLPFPGWTLPNVTGIGGLQALVKSGLPVKGKRVVLGGTGPLLLAVAAYLRKLGATVPVIVEQAELSSLMRFGIGLARHPEKLMQAIALRTSLAGTRYLPGSWVTAAEGSNAVSRAQIHCTSGTQTVECDYLAVAWGFTPNVDLATLLGCRLQAVTEDDFVSVDAHQRTSVAGVLCAGETTGLGGVDLSLVEGEIAGYSAGGRTDLAQKLFPLRERARRLAANLNRTFTLRNELRGLADAETTICRCEDVRLGTLQTAASWRAAKLHARCGMGPCQGGVCGPAVRFLFGWKPDSVRPPLFAPRIASLLSESTPKEAIKEMTEIIST
jgi:NADPH-dependent 2,4-dienoyl-CoA reductase/sulfur reductase-like enzyme